MSKNTKSNGGEEEKEDPGVNEPLTRKHRKRGRQFLKDVKRFMRYNRDLISDKNHEKIAATREQYIGTVEAEATTRGELSKAVKDLSDTCERSVKGYKASALRDNIESFFVVILLVAGIRTYFLQPFKIPTGSMQPTLNGVIAYPKGDDYEPPGFAKRAFDWVWSGRTYVKKVAGQEMVLAEGRESQTGLIAMQQKPFLLYFTRTYVIGADGKPAFSVGGTEARVRELIRSENAVYDANRRTFTFPGGSVVAAGELTTGDQVFVDRFTYHWRKPRRGEVFVFNTRGIRGIEMDSRFDVRGGSQHYIKRLAGLPGDVVEIESPLLKINGEVPEHPGFQKVMSQENGYRGYQNGYIKPLGPGQYCALGDNSYNSFDSKGWGHVPEENIIGRGVFVFLPLGQHFGPIE